MKLVRSAWKLLVAVKDGLVLVAMLLFFGLLFAALSARPNTQIRDGALVVDLDGTIVEQPSEVDPFAQLAGGEVINEHRLRDVVRAIDAARDDKRVKAVVLDLDSFRGGYPALLSEVADALLRVRGSGKPVLAYATAYTDPSYRLAAAASEVWMHPLGGTLIQGSGGTQLYFKGLIDRLGVNVHVYRVGQFKAAVEPFTRADQSEPARRANQALYGTLFEQWREGVAKARPKARLDQVIGNSAALVQAAGGDLGRATLAAGLVDKLGDRVAFGKRVAEIAGVEPEKLAGSYKRIKLADFAAAHPAPRTGDAIGVITIAGEIVDGKAGPGTAAGDTVSRLLLKGLAEKQLKALVVRVDSPGGSVMASEQIRQAILEAKQAKLPIVVSMGGLAASGGYWVSTPADVIFAEPNTITGSIGIFGIIPTFENTLAKIGVTGDGVQTTPLTGQPDVVRGTNATFDTILQANIEHGYRNFINLVAQSRRMTPARVDQIGQGRVWDGGTARQLGLVDRFGNLSDAIAEAARRAKLDPAKVHPEYLDHEPSPFAAFAAALAAEEDEDARTAGTDLVGRMAEGRRQVLATALGDARRLVGARASMQARCLECAGAGPVVARPEDLTLLDLAMARLGW